VQVEEVAGTVCTTDDEEDQGKVEEKERGSRIFKGSRPGLWRGNCSCCAIMPGVIFVFKSWKPVEEVENRRVAEEYLGISFTRCSLSSVNHG